MQLPSWLKTTWRILRWLLLAILLLAMTLIAALWRANRHDDPLRPEVAALLKFDPPSPEAMRGNGYFIMLGLGAPAGEDAFEAGKRFFQVQLKEYEELRRTGHLVRSPESAYPRHQAIKTTPMACHAEALDCYIHYRKHAEAIRAALTTDAAAITRYLSLLDAPEYVEVTLPSPLVNWPNYADHTAASELVLMRAALLLDSSQRAEGLALLVRNAQIHQRMMSGARSRVGAMIALAAQMKQQRLISSALRHIPRTVVDGGAYLAALEAHPMDLSASMEDELAQTFSFLDIDRAAGNPFVAPDDLTWIDRLSQRWQRAWTRLTLLPNATMNAIYQDRKSSIVLTRLPADQLDAQAMAVHTKVDASLEPYWYPIPLPLRNPMGEAVRNIATLDSLVTYIERAHDVEAHLRLVQLQIKALQEHIPFDQMPAWLAAQPPELRNPYTLQPMGWDAATQSLVFEGRQPNNQNPEPRNVFRVPIAPVATGSR